MTLQKAPEPMSDEAINALGWKPVTSSNVAAIAQEGEYLYARFKSGGVYRYNLPAAEGFDLLLEADADPAGSVGKTFHRHVVTRSKSPGVDAARIEITDPR